MSAFNRGALSPKPFNSEQLYTGSGSHTVAAGVTRVRISAVGAGGGTDLASARAGNGTFVQRELTVTPGQVLPVVIGAGHAANTQGEGGDTSVGTITAKGGGRTTTTGTRGGDGSAWGVYGIGGSTTAASTAGAALIEW